MASKNDKGMQDLSIYDLTPDDIQECYKEWPEDSNLTLFQLIGRKTISKYIHAQRPMKLFAGKDVKIQLTADKDVTTTNHENT